MNGGKLVIETELGTKNFDAQLSSLENKLKAVESSIKREQALISLTGKQAEGLDMDNLKNSLIKNQAEAEKLKNQILDIKSKTIQVDETSEKSSSNLSRNINKGTSMLKKFGFRLLSVASIYSVVSKASSAWLSQDTELANKLQSVWVGLGSFLAPAIEYISNILLKALGYINVFVKALTGIDFVAKANAKSLNKQAQAQKNLNNQTYDFDEIRKQQEISDSGSSGSVSTPQIQIPELDEKLVSKLQNLAKWLKENWDLIKLVGEALLITFGAVKIAKVISGISSLIGSATLGKGLSALLPILTALAAVWTIKLYVDGYKKVKKEIGELNEQLEINKNRQKELTSQIGDTNDMFKNMVETGEITTDQMQNYTNWLGITTNSLGEQYIALEKNKTAIGTFTGYNKKLTEQQKEIVKSLEEVTSGYEKLYNRGLLNEEETKEYTKALASQIQIMKNLGLDTEELQRKYQQLTGQPYNLNVNVNDYATDKLEKLKNKIEQVKESAKGLGGIIIDSQAGQFGGGGGGSRFALGGIVTQPTRALIGEAGYPEAVVPMAGDYLSTLASEISKYSGGGTSQINVYLDGRLIQRQIENKSNQLGFATNR